jgi:hypothetical protein
VTATDDEFELPYCSRCGKYVQSLRSLDSLIGIAIRYGVDDRQIMVQLPAMARDIYLLQNLQDSDSMERGLFSPPKAGSDQSPSSSDRIKNVCSRTSSALYTFRQRTRKASLYTPSFKINIQFLLGYRRMRLKVFLR